MKETKKILPTFCVAIQYWDGDAADAMKLLKLICDLQKGFNPNVEIMLSLRRDVSWEPTSHVARAMEKFAITVFRGARREVGYPAGCNALWHDTAWEAHRMVKEGRRQWTGILTTEADSVPTCPEWLDVLMDDWQKCLNAKKLVMGHIVKQPLHVNGNLVISPDFLKKYPACYGCSVDVSWDMHYAKLMLEEAIDSKHMVSHWKTPSITEEDLYHPADGKKPVFVHGVKDSSAREIVRKKYGLAPEE